MFLRVVGESLNQTEQIALGCFEISGCWLIINFLVYFALGGPASIKRTEKKGFYVSCF